MHHTPLFSIIVPTYNRAEKLRRALLSLVQQTHRDFEVIVCDDGSTDNTGEVVESLKHQLPLTYMRDEHWGGPARPRNRGIKAARGEWISFLDADDWWYPNRLEVVRQHLEGADVVYHALHTSTGNGINRWRKTKARQVHPPVVAELLSRGNALTNSGVTVRKAIADDAGGLTEEKTIVSLEDWDFWLKIAKITGRFRYISRCLGAYSVDKDNITEFTERQVQRIEAFYDRNLGLLSGREREDAERFRDYMVGRIKQRLGLRREALLLLKRSMSSASLGIRLKSLAAYALVKTGWALGSATRYHAK